MTLVAGITACVGFVLELLTACVGLWSTSKKERNRDALSYDGELW